MRIKKFSHRFKKSYRLIVMMMITASLLGVSYGYWSDVNTIKAEVKTPRVELECTKVTYEYDIEVYQGDELSEMNRIHLAKKDDKDEMIFKFDVEATVGGHSSIPIEYLDYEIYFVKNSLSFSKEEVLLEDGKKTRGNGDFLKKLDVEVKLIKEDTKEKKYSFEIKMSDSKLKSLLKEQGNGCTMGDLKIKLNFIQQGMPEREGWQYFVEKVYKVRFIEPMNMNQENVLGAGQLGLEGVEPRGILTGDGELTSGTTPDSGAPASSTELDSGAPPSSTELDSEAPASSTELDSEAPTSSTELDGGAPASSTAPDSEASTDSTASNSRESGSISTDSDTVE